MLQALASLELEDVVSTNPDKRGTYQVDSTGTRVQVLQGDKVVLSLMVGKSTPDFAHTYVRPEDRAEVYRAVGVLTYNFNKRVDDWRDKTVLEVDQESVSRVVLEYPKEGTDVVLARADSLWTVVSKGAEPQPADSTAAAQLVRSAARIVTANFATPEEAAGLDFAQPDFRLRVETDGGTQTVEFVEHEGNKFYARRPGETTVFQLFKPGLAGVMKKADDLKPKAS
jgi:hypothetical protein